MLLYDAGEASNAGALAAIMRAVADVPAPLGVARTDTPATCERVWRAPGAAKRPHMDPEQQEVRALRGAHARACRRPSSTLAPSHRGRTRLPSRIEITSVGLTAGHRPRW